MRRKARVVKIGGISIGGHNPIVIQSMAKTRTARIGDTVKEIGRIQECGGQIVRLAVKDKPDAQALKEIKRESLIPLVADIHFDWRLAIMAIDAGIDKIRLNPGNIYEKNQIREISFAARINRIPIRVGVNSGSLIKGGGRRLKAGTISGLMVESAMDYIRILEGFKFFDLVISLKASDIFDTIKAYRKIASLCSYPLHLGVTATGPYSSGLVKSSIALSALLFEGIGDTIRVSLTAPAQEEVRAAKFILSSLKLRSFGAEIISCPTCGRCPVNLSGIVKELEKRVSFISPRPGSALRPLKIAVMGCLVNGPGEAREADLGLAFGRKEALFFKKGKPINKVSRDACVDLLVKEVLKYR
ncbi:MAG: flavodoxin-dependent (E)-4-hydroxy-3-methylbut-2-enyl-diphosphate synthase [Candidatus Omnitrophota bacterium]